MKQLVVLSICAAFASHTVGSEEQVGPANWPALKVELEAMQKTDQTLRNEFTAMLVEARTRGREVDSKARGDIWKKINEQDRVNQQRVAEIIDTFGWPAKSKVGTVAATTVFLVVQHAGLEFQQMYVDGMRRAAAIGEAEKSQLALLEDRLLIRQGQPQLYGSQIDNRRGVDLFPVSDPENLNLRRKEMGLGPICEHLQHFVQQAGPIIYPPCREAAGASAAKK